MFPVDQRLGLGRRASGSRPIRWASRAAPSPPFTLYDPSLSLSYTLDVFGGIRRQVEQLGAQVDYQRFELEATYLNLTSNVVIAALTEASLQAQIDATQDIIRIYQQALKVTQSRFELGGVSRSDVLQQQANLASALATLPPLQKQLEQERNQLAVYLGTRPGPFQRTRRSSWPSLTLPEDLPVSLPSQPRRAAAGHPGLRGAAARGDARRSASPPRTCCRSSRSAPATAAKAPSIADLFTPAGIVWSLAGAVSQPVFQGGTLLRASAAPRRPRLRSRRRSTAARSTPPSRRSPTRWSPSGAMRKPCAPPCNRRRRPRQA